MSPSMKTKDRYPSAKRLDRPAFLLVLAAMTTATVGWSHGAVDGVKIPIASSAVESDGCPKCKQDGDETTQWLQRADTLYASFKTAEALRELLKILQINPQHHEALCKTARAYIDLGDMIPETGPGWQDKRLLHYGTAEQYARRAVKSDSESTWGHFYLAASLGKIALNSPIPKQIDLSHEIRQQVEKALELDPRNGFAYHVYGIWQRRMAEIGQMSRMLASVLLWRTVPKGSFEKSEEYFDKAISLNPKIIVHRLELAKTYLVQEKWPQARNSLKAVLELPVQFSDDSLHKREARTLLEEVRDR